MGLCGAGATAVRARRRRGGAGLRRVGAEAAGAADEGIEPVAGLDGSTEYKRHLASVMVRQALEAAGA